MSSRNIIGFLRGVVTLIFYSHIFFIVFFIVLSVISFWDKDDSANLLYKSNLFTYEAMNFGIKKSNEEKVVLYSKDSVIQANEIKDHYKLWVKPGSPISYYAFIAQLISLGISFGVLLTFKRIFKQTNIERPFTRKMVKHLQTLALLFIISDVLKLINYFSLGALLSKSFGQLIMRFELLTTVGGGIITGLIIWVLAVIFQRGIELQEENALTV